MGPVAYLFYESPSSVTFYTYLDTFNKRIIQGFNEGIAPTTGLKKNQITLQASIKNELRPLTNIRIPKVDQ